VAAINNKAFEYALLSVLFFLFGPCLRSYIYLCLSVTVVLQKRPLNADIIAMVNSGAAHFS
jgi:hypothetical protein